MAVPAGGAAPAGGTMLAVTIPQGEERTHAPREITNNYCTNVGTLYHEQVGTTTSVGATARRNTGEIETETSPPFPHSTLRI